MCTSADCRKILRGYASSKRMLQVWQVERGRLREELRAVSVPAAPSIAVSGSASLRQSIVERAVLRREKYRARLDELDVLEHDARLSMSLVENALAAVPEFDASLLRRHYLRGESWIMIADDVGYSLAAVRMRASRAVRSVARAMPSGAKAWTE